MMRKIRHVLAALISRTGTFRGIPAVLAIGVMLLGGTLGGVLAVGPHGHPMRASAGTAIPIAPLFNEVSDGLPVNATTYHTFSDTTTNYSYAGGPVTLSTCTDGSCTIVADDALKLTVTHPDGTSWSHEWDFYTKDQTPADVTGAFQTGTNVVRAQLIDLVGPDEGSPRPFYLVAAPAPAPAVTVTVTKGAHFIDTDPTDSAQVYLHIHVARADGAPVSGAKVRLSNPNAFLFTLSNVTDSNGNLVAPVALPPGPLVGNTPVTGDVTSAVVALVDGQEYSSASLMLYSGDRLDTTSDVTLTRDEAATYYLDLLLYNASQPDLSSLCGLRFCFIESVAMELFDIIRANNAYSPQTGDVLRARVYEYTSDGVTPVYLLDESATRAGNTIYYHAGWTEAFANVQQYLPQVALARPALAVRFASPVTALLTDPSGMRVGWDPSAGKPVYDEFGLVSAVGAEPYELVIPAAASGQYTLLVTGTANGTYAMDTFGLDGNGNASPRVPIGGVAVLGYTDTYFITYPAPPGQPIFVQRKVPVDVMPGDPVGSINPTSGGLTPVAILSTPTFDATTANPGTLKFGPANAPAVRCSVQDVNSDGVTDLLCQFKTNRTGITPGSTSATVTGQTRAGVNIIGSDTIRTSP